MQPSPRRLGDNIIDRISRLSVNVSDSGSTEEQDDGGAATSRISESDDNHGGSPPSSSAQSRSEPDSGGGHMLSPLSPIPVTAVYVVTKAHIVRTGANATIEPPATRSEVLAVCLRAERAREVAKKAWRQSFAYAVPDGKTEEFDALGLERLLVGCGSAKGVEVFRVANRRFVSGEDGVEVLEGERMVAVWRVGVDGAEGGEEEEDEGGRTPVSE